MDALIRILTEPKNALIKQYKKLFEVEGVELKFTDEAFRVISSDAIKRKSGARGLRAILESVMLDVMYDIPNMPGIRECIIGEEVITRGESPLLLYENQVGYA
jgi:ATP-dependent Clp protease ATP-binding subunit ClpX